MTETNTLDKVSVEALAKQLNSEMLELFNGAVLDRSSIESITRKVFDIMESYLKSDIGVEDFEYYEAKTFIIFKSMAEFLTFTRVKKQTDRIRQKEIVIFCNYGRYGYNSYIQQMKTIVSRIGWSNKIKLVDGVLNSKIGSALVQYYQGKICSCFYRSRMNGDSDLSVQFLYNFPRPPRHIKIESSLISKEVVEE